MTHLSLGLTDRDRVSHALGGGLPDGSIVLIEGGQGAGKSVLTARLVYGLCTEGTDVGLVSPQLPAREYIPQMASMSYDVVEHLLAGRLRYFHVPTDGNRRLVQRFLTPGALWDATVVAIDGFGSLCRNDPDVGELLGTGREDRAMERIVARLDPALAADKLVLLTVDPGVVSERLLRPLRAAATVFIELESETVGQEIRKRALVRRYADMQRPVDDTIGFAVQQGRGIVIESRTIA